MSPKTYLRETAWFCMGWLLAIATFLIFTSDAAQGYQVLSLFVVPITTFVAFAFGAKVYSNQQDKQDATRSSTAPPGSAG